MKKLMFLWPGALIALCALPASAADDVITNICKTGTLNGTVVHCGNNCCAPSQTQCTSVCEFIVAPLCPEECRFINWTDIGAGKQARCNVNECEYQCADGYYAVVPWGGGMTCKACPANGTCAAGSSKPVCDAGYYASGNGTTGYSCNRCPSIVQYQNTSGTGWGTTVYGNSAKGSSAITQCYITSGIGYKDDVGTFTITGNCYYKN